MVDIIFTLLAILLLCMVLLVMKDKKKIMNIANKNRESSEDMVNKTLEYREKDLEIKQEIVEALKRIEDKLSSK